MIKLHAQEWHIILGRGCIAVIANVPDQIPNVEFHDLIHKTVSIDGKLYEIRGVETQGSSRRMFGLLIKGEK